MFLSNLSIKEQYFFLELADKLIHLDGESRVSEQALFSSYITEMGLTKDYEIQGIDTETILNSITTSQIQKIIYIELLALCNIDLDFNIKEKEFMRQIAVGFNLPHAFIINCELWIKEINNCYKKGYSLIFS